MKRALTFAIAVALAACGPRIKPEVAPEKPSDTISDAPDAPSRRGASPQQEILIGEMCPSAVSGRPGVMPVVMRRLSWEDDRDELAEVLERSMAKQFSVLGWDGRRVGVFSVIGAATAPSGRVFAAGSYAGGSACEVRAAGGTKPVPDCEKTLLSCGLAIAPLRPAGGLGAAPFEEDPDPASFEPSGVCVDDGKLLVDLDGDGKVEAFSVDAFVDPFRAPANEVTAISRGKSKCTPSFAARSVVPPGDPRDWRGLDVIGTLDLDGDGRAEIIAVYNYQARRTWAVYSARSSGGRLDLVGEGVPWPRGDWAKEPSQQVMPETSTE
jgi:hypothetical protein